MKPSLYLFFILFVIRKCVAQAPNSTVAKCSIYDEACQLIYYQTLGRQNAHTGIPALGVPVLDPFRVSNVTMSILGLFNLTLLDGEVEGIGTCTLLKYVTNVPRRYKEPAMVCSKIIIRGQYKLTAAPVVQKTLGDIHGEGNGTITFEDWFFEFHYPFQIVRRANGQIYMHALFEEGVYKAREGKVTLQVNGIKMGHRDISDSVTCFINDNWKLIMGSDIGKFINDKSAQYYYDIYNIFYERVPATNYLSDDLSSLVDN